MSGATARIPDSRNINLERGVLVTDPRAIACLVSAQLAARCFPDLYPSLLVVRSE
jgi:hypothetical protein